MHTLNDYLKLVPWAMDVDAKDYLMLPKKMRGKPQNRWVAYFSFQRLNSFEWRAGYFVYDY